MTTVLGAHVASGSLVNADLAPTSPEERTWGLWNIARGGLIAGGVGISIFPWVLLDRYQTWLLSYSGLLGAVAGVLVCDYVIVRRCGPSASVCWWLFPASSTRGSTFCSAAPGSQLPRYRL